MAKATKAAKPVKAAAPKKANTPAKVVAIQTPKSGVESAIAETTPVLVAFQNNTPIKDSGEAGNSAKATDVNATKGNDEPVEKAANGEALAAVQELQNVMGAGSLETENFSQDKDVQSQNEAEQSGDTEDEESESETEQYSAFKDELALMVDRYKKAYPDAKALFITSDNQVFLDRNKQDAFAHQKAVKKTVAPIELPLN